MADKLSLIDAEIRACRSKMVELNGKNMNFLRADLQHITEKDQVIINYKTIPLTYENEADREKANRRDANKRTYLEECKCFREWIEKAENNFKLNSVHIQSIDLFGPRIGFIKVKASITDATDTEVPSIAFLRGGSVAILMRIMCENTYYSILTSQARVPVGKYMLEIPAGMTDDTGDFTGAAAKELKEETGIEINQKKLIDLCMNVQGKNEQGETLDRAYPSCGGCDEYMKLFLYEMKIDHGELIKLQGKLTGVLEEGEVIFLKIVKFDDLIKESDDMKMLSALALFNVFDAKRKSLEVVLSHEMKSIPIDTIKANQMIYYMLADSVREYKHIIEENKHKMEKAITQMQAVQLQHATRT